MKILHIISSTDPKYGGVIEGINQLSLACQALGAQVEICCLDEADFKWVKNSKVKVHGLGSARWNYAYSKNLIPWLRNHAHDYDAVIVNGLWQYTGYAVRQALKGTSTPYFVFTHGMLSPWWKIAYPLKHMKKWLYWLLVEYHILRGARNVIFTCEEERLLARESFWLYSANEVVTAFGVEDPPSNEDELVSEFMLQFPQLQGKRIVLFLGRIHAVKGCDLLIEGFSRIAHQDKNLHLLIVGPDQTGWISELKDQAESLNISHRITWSGILLGDLKWEAFYAADVFCLPSHHENFGIVVAEALACGKPVLISNKVNIWREIEREGVGFIAADTLEGTVSNFDKWLELSPAEFKRMEVKAKKCFANNFHVKRAAERLIEIIKVATEKDS